MTEPTPIYWVRYAYAIKDARIHPLVHEIATGEVLSIPQGQALADLMNEIDKKEGKGHWVCDYNPEITSWNFAGVSVEYNGKNSPNLPTKGNMDNVIILVFPPTSIAPVSRLYIPYNNPAV